MGGGGSSSDVRACARRPYNAWFAATVLYACAPHPARPFRPSRPLHVSGADSVQAERCFGAGGHRPRGGRAGSCRPRCDAPSGSGIRPSFGPCPEQMMGSKSRMQGQEALEQEIKVKSSVGIDVCKSWLDAHVLPAGMSMRVPNTAAGIRTLKRRLAPFDVGLVAVEATGKWHRVLCRSLHASGLAVAEEIMLNNQLAAAEGKFLKRQLARRIARIGQDIKALEGELQKRIRADGELARRYAILVSIPGFGPVVASTLITRLAELGACTAKQIGSLAGLAPRANESGQHKGVRVIGRASATSSTWPPSRPHVATPTSRPSTNGTWPPTSQPRPCSPRSRENSPSSPIPSSPKIAPGSPMPLTQLDTQHRCSPPLASRAGGGRVRAAEPQCAKAAGPEGTSPESAAGAARPIMMACASPGASAGR